MTQGIRAFVNTRFATLLPKFVAGELDGKAFRAKVMEGAVSKFGITIASAATHYNHALKMQRVVDAKSVDGLGRPEDKKGGRKPIHVVTVVKARSGEIVAEGVSRGAAEQMIAKAAAKRGVAKLAIFVAEPEAATA